MSLKPDDKNQRPPQDQATGAPSPFDLGCVSPATEGAPEAHQMSHVRAEFLHEQGRLSDDHVIVQRVGYLGSKRGEFVERMNKLYGEGAWTIGYVLDGKALTRDAALELYERSYEIFLRNNPSITHRLVNEAREIYDTAPSNVESGLDYHKQEDVRSHLQDIAIRRAMKNMGLSFEGDKLMQVREADSDFPELSPGKVPFVLPKDKIIFPIEYKADWIQPGSVEDFWQNNKFVFATRTPDVVSRLRNEVERLLAIGEAGDRVAIEEGVVALTLLGGEKAITKQYIDYVKKNKLVDVTPGGITVSPIEFCAQRIVENLSQSLLTREIPFHDVLATVDALSPMYEHLGNQYAMESLIGIAPDSVRTSVHAAMACTFMNHLNHGEWNTRENLHSVLSTPGVLEMLKTNQECRDYLKSTEIMQQTSWEISAQLKQVLIHEPLRPIREQIRDILLDIKREGGILQKCRDLWKRGG